MRISCGFRKNGRKSRIEKQGPGKLGAAGTSLWQLVAIGVPGKRVFPPHDPTLTASGRDFAKGRCVERATSSRNPLNIDGVQKRRELIM